jgi:hypothetical protein
MPTWTPTIAVCEAPAEEPAAGHQVFGWPAMRGRRFMSARGMYRIFNSAGYRFYRLKGSPPREGSVPFATSASLPHTPTATYSDGAWYLSASYFNGVLDSGFLPLGPAGETYVRLDIAGGIVTGSPPAGPLDWRLEQLAGGIVRIQALAFDASPNRADEWAITYTTNGATPPVNSPTATVECSAGGLAVLVYDLPAAANGVTVKVRLQTRRNDGSEETPVWVYSEASTVKSLVIATTGPTAALGAERWPGTLPAEAETA